MTLKLCLSFFFLIKTLQIVSSIETVTNSQSSQIPDPCFNYMVLDGEWRQVNNTIPGNHCDNNLTEGWYRAFINGIPASLPKVCIKGPACGVASPLHIELIDDPVVGEVGTADLCASSVIYDTWECCIFRHRIHLKNCGNFYVYRLLPRRRCFVGYCTLGEYHDVEQFTAKTGESVGEYHPSNCNPPSHPNCNPGNHIRNKHSISTRDLPSPVEALALQCDNGFFKCQDNRRCVPNNEICDDTFNCDDRSDESNCTNTPYCPESTGRCPDGSCRIGGSCDEMSSAVANTRQTRSEKLVFTYTIPGSDSYRGITTSSPLNSSQTNVSSVTPENKHQRINDTVHHVSFSESDFQQYSSKFNSQIDSSTFPVGNSQLQPLQPDLSNTMNHQHSLESFIDVKFISPTSHSFMSNSEDGVVSSSLLVNDNAESTKAYISPSGQMWSDDSVSTLSGYEKSGIISSLVNNIKDASTFSYNSDSQAYSVESSEPNSLHHSSIVESLTNAYYKTTKFGERLSSDGILFSSASLTSDEILMSSERPFPGKSLVSSESLYIKESFISSAIQSSDESYLYDSSSFLDSKRLRSSDNIAFSGIIATAVLNSILSTSLKTSSPITFNDSQSIHIKSDSILPTTAVSPFLSSLMMTFKKSLISHSLSSQITPNLSSPSNSSHEYGFSHLSDSSTFSKVTDEQNHNFAVGVRKSSTPRDPYTVPISSTTLANNDSIIIRADQGITINFELFIPVICGGVLFMILVLIGVIYCRHRSMARNWTCRQQEYYTKCEKDALMKPKQRTSLYQLEETTQEENQMIENTSFYLSFPEIEREVANEDHEGLVIPISELPALETNAKTENTQF